MYSRAPLWIRGTFCLLPAALTLMAANRAWGRQNDAIVVSATAESAYVRPLDGNGRPAPETYVFMEGAHFGGGVADASEKRVSFDTITHVLAANLVKQNYFPTRDVAGAKLLLRVFWGTTQIYEDPQKQLSMDALNSALNQYKSDIGSGNSSTMADMEVAGIADPGRANEILSGQGLEQDSANTAVARNAILLGYRRTLDKLSEHYVPTAEEQTLRGELSEERYFVVIMAYDYEYMRREKKPRLLWITRLSIRSPGNNFTEALPALALAGAGSFGRNQAELQRVKVRNLPGGEVTMPDVKLLGPADAGEKK